MSVNITISRDIKSVSELYEQKLYFQYRDLHDFRRQDGARIKIFWKREVVVAYWRCSSGIFLETLRKVTANFSRAGIPVEIRTQYLSNTTLVTLILILMS
jgi:hypothetical protein